MFRLAHALFVLLAATPLLAVPLRDGNYRISYSPAPCGLETRHYLGLSARTANATFSPVPEAQAQVWAVTSSASFPTWRSLESVQYPRIYLGYPNATREVRVRGIEDTNTVDNYYFNIIEVPKDGYYYVYPNGNRDMVVNGDTRIEARNRFAYFRGDSTQFPLPMLPLLFTPVPDLSIEV